MKTENEEVTFTVWVMDYKLKKEKSLLFRLVFKKWGVVDVYVDGKHCSGELEDKRFNKYQW